MRQGDKAPAAVDEGFWGLPTDPRLTVAFGHAADGSCHKVTGEDRARSVYPRGATWRDVFERVGTLADLAYLRCRMSRCDSFAETLDMMSGSLYEVSEVSKSHRFTW